jgi:hypothetical protein
MGPPFIGSIHHLLTSQPQVVFGQIDMVVMSSAAAAQEVLYTKDLTKRHGRMMYLQLGQIHGGCGAPAVLAAAWMANGRGVDGGPEQRFDGDRWGGGSCGSRRGRASCGDGGDGAPVWCRRGS